MPRAEIMWALYRALLFLAGQARDEEEPFDTAIWTDSAVVMKAFAKGPNTRHGPNGEIWDMIWENFSILATAGCRVSVHKVAAHAVEKGIAQDPFLTAGNELADHFAGVGAASHSVEELQPLVEHVDIRARLILHRLLALSELFLIKAKKGEKEPPIPKLPRLDVAIRTLGHAPSPVGKWEV